jgi:hypothetical protein
MNKLMPAALLILLCGCEKTALPSPNYRVEHTGGGGAIWTGTHTTELCAIVAPAGNLWTGTINTYGPLEGQPIIKEFKTRDEAFAYVENSKCSTSAK